MHAALDAQRPLLPRRGLCRAEGRRAAARLDCAVNRWCRRAEYPLPPRLQLQSATQALRMIDCQHAFSHAQCRLLLRNLPTRARTASDGSLTRARVVAAPGQDRADARYWAADGARDRGRVPPARAIGDRVAYRRGDAGAQLGVHDLFRAFNQTRNGLLSCSESCRLGVDRPALTRPTCMRCPSARLRRRRAAHP